MGGVLEQEEDGGRLAAHRGQAQVVGAQLRAGGVADARPHGVVVHHQRRAGGGLHAAGTTTAFAPALARLALLPGGGVGEQAVEAFAVPLVGPEQAGQRGQEVQQQAPGAGHGVQVPVEAAALARPVQGQPGTPARGLARPAQVKAGEAEEDEGQGAGGGDLLAGFAHGEEAVQLQHQAEERLAGRFAQQFAGVGVEPAHGATAFARWRGEEDPCGFAAFGAYPEAGDRFACDGFDAADQLGRGQHAALAHLDLEGVAVEQLEDLLLEAVGRPGDAHD